MEIKVPEVEQTVWGIHGGRAGDADTLFLRRNLVALGWPELGDLSRLGASREAFKAAAEACFPDRNPGNIRNCAGQLFRFLHEMRIGDLVVYPSRSDRLVHVGRVTGEYRFVSDEVAAYPNRRTVEWKRRIPRTQLSQGALYEIGSALSFFQVRNYADEFTSESTAAATAVVSALDPSVAAVTEDIEETTRDFVLKRLARDLKGHPLASFVGHLLVAMGYRVRVSPEGPDRGVDIVAHKDDLGFEPPIIKVQVKSTEGSVSEPLVASLCGVVGEKECGLFVTLGTFTAQARRLADGRSNIQLVDGARLVDLVFQHYEAFDALYKGMIPLKRVYIPDAIEENVDV
ncbi:MAG: restriction endonuclease [Phycisphaera sp.]|nr:restriction endonuclease [Phycisphaera sp.]